jgi:hypothetical protein
MGGNPEFLEVLDYSNRRDKRPCLGGWEYVLGTQARSFLGKMHDFWAKTNNYVN